MRNLFLINEDEKNRILNLHENATKKQYLTEQTNTTTESPEKIAEKLAKASDSPGTMENDIVSAIEKIKDQNTFTLVNNLISKYTRAPKYSSIQDMLNGELESDNLSTVRKIANYLKTISITMKWKKNDQGLTGGGEKYSRFVSNSIKITVPNIGTQNQDNQEKSILAWKRFPCVTSHLNAKQTKDKNGSVVYLIDGVYYYANGRKKMKDGKMANYTCNDPEFKQKGGSNVGAKVAMVMPSDVDLDKFLNA
jgi:hypothetical protein